MPVFRSVQDNDVVERIRAAKTRVVYVAPGVSKDVAQALQTCIEGKGVSQIAIVLDGDEESCRLGYCDAASLEKLSAVAINRGMQIRRHAGIRLGLLLSDQEVMIWAPTPLMFEAPRDSKEPNGLILTPETFEVLPNVLGMNPETPTNEVEISTAALTSDEVKLVVDAIKAVPLVSFDLTRLSRVFSAKFQFIETVLRGAELTKREMRLDSLIVNSDAPDELRPLLHTTVQPFNTDANKTVEVPVIVSGEQAFRKNGDPILKPTTQADIHGYWEDLTQRYIVNLPGFGKLIRHTDKAKFEAGKAAFELVLTQWVKGFRKLVEGDHEVRVTRIVDLIERRMKQSSAKVKPDRAKIQALVLNGLDGLRMIEPSVKVVYKNITVESTRDKEFLDALRKALPEDELKGWFQIFDAAPAVQEILEM
ncbi:MAG: hypothetical protein HY661_07700 [Betaproteobacteria bacterium]|nr:hypothetical protein [Betaproteobacteria bacterium]